MTRNTRNVSKPRGPGGKSNFYKILHRSGLWQGVSEVGAVTRAVSLKRCVGSRLRLPSNSANVRRFGAVTRRYKSPAYFLPYPITADPTHLVAHRVPDRYDTERADRKIALHGIGRGESHEKEEGFVHTDRTVCGVAAYRFGIAERACRTGLGWASAGRSAESSARHPARSR